MTVVSSVELGSDEYLGEVFTRRWVVEAILDFVGYTADRDLADLVLVEPAAGAGAFLGPVTERLAASALAHGRDLASLTDAVLAFDLRPENVTAARQTVTTALLAAGATSGVADSLAETWVTEGDYLLDLTIIEGTVDVVVGNPPYLRIEDVPEDRSGAYRSAHRSMIGRADVFVGFYENALRSLAPGGTLGFICADRWLRNAYGAALRELVTTEFSLDVVLSCHDVDVFEDAVAAYPAITVISRRKPDGTLVIDAEPGFGAEQATAVARAAIDRGLPEDGDHFTATRVPTRPPGRAPFPAGSADRLAFLAALERFPTLEETGVRVGIGVASGADAVYLVPADPGIEDDRLLPLVTASDLVDGVIAEKVSTYLVNPWESSGLVDLDRFPLLSAYYEKNGDVLRGRHVARSKPAAWYRTIDRVDPDFIAIPKLLVPDLRSALEPVLDPGTRYPHHNLYTVTSEAWDLRVLGGLLLARTATAVVASHCVLMRGGTLRFQAQYLRRIRVPSPEAIPPKEAAGLAASFDARDVEAATAIALSLYGLDDVGL